MVIGFTGTRAGMTPNQKEELLALLYGKKPDLVLHGICIGADEEFHRLVRELPFKVIIEGFPCTIFDQQAECDVDVRNAVEHPLIRNRRIVERSDLMIAAPRTTEEEQRSGTWATIRYARKLKKRIELMRPHITPLEERFQ
jgi:hypothetical protein